MSGGTLNLNLNLGGGGGGKKIGENKVARAVAFKVKKKEGKKKGRKIFVHNVSEKATYVDFQASVVKFGKVTGQSEYSRIIHRQSLMNNTEVAGRTIKMNIARPKGEKGGDRRNDVEVAKLFVHSKDTSQEDLRGAFEKHGTVTDAYNPGKGFAFVTFSSPDEAQAAIKAMDGSEVCGQAVNCTLARKRRELSNEEKKLKLKVKSLEEMLK